jgi:GDP-4-dehydro-6-deoxy-D-mannose reductase
VTTALITGAGGFCARALACRLEEERVVGSGRRAEPADGKGLDDYEQVDITDAGKMSDLVARVKPDWIFHLAGVFRSEPVEIFRINFMGTVSLLEAARTEAPDARVVVVGSAAEYGIVQEADLPLTEETACHPKGAYGVSKHAVTLLALDYATRTGMKVVVARPFNAVGAGIPGQLVLGAVLRRVKDALLSGRDRISIGNLDSSRDFVSVEDLADAYVRMVQADRWGDVFQLCSGKPVKIRSLVELALTFAPRPISLEIDSTLVRPTEIPVAYGSPKKAQDAFGFRPSVPLEDAVRAAWDCEMQEVAG